MSKGRPGVFETIGFCEAENDVEKHRRRTERVNQDVRKKVEVGEGAA